VTAHAQKPDFLFRRNGRVHLNRRGPQFSRLLAAELCASVVVMLDTPCSVVVLRVLATHSIRQFPLHFPSRASPCDITFQLDSTRHLKLFCFTMAQQTQVVQGRLIIEASWSHSDTIGRTPLDKRSARRKDLYLTTHNTHNRQIFTPLCAILSSSPSKRTAKDQHLRQRSHWDRS